MCGAPITPRAISPILTLLKRKTRENVKLVKAFQHDNGVLDLPSRQQRRLDYRSNRPKDTTTQSINCFCFSNICLTIRLQKDNFILITCMQQIASFILLEIAHEVIAAACTASYSEILRTKQKAFQFDRGDDAWWLLVLNRARRLQTNIESQLKVTLIRILWPSSTQRETTSTSKNMGSRVH